MNINVRLQGHQAYHDRMGKWENPHKEEDELEHKEWICGWVAASDGKHKDCPEYW